MSFHKPWGSLFADTQPIVILKKLTNSVYNKVNVSIDADADYWCKTIINLRTGFPLAKEIIIYN